MENLKAWLDAQYQSQDWLAKQLGVTQPAVSAWMIGRNRPGADTLLKLRDVTGLTVDQLMDREAA